MFLGGNQDWRKTWQAGIPSAIICDLSSRRLCIFFVLKYRVQIALCPLTSWPSFSAPCCWGWIRPCSSRRVCWVHQEGGSMGQGRIRGVLSEFLTAGGPVMSSGSLPSFSMSELQWSAPRPASSQSSATTETCLGRFFLVKERGMQKGLGWVNSLWLVEIVQKKKCHFQEHY